MKRKILVVGQTYPEPDNLTLITIEQLLLSSFDAELITPDGINRLSSFDFDEVFVIGNISPYLKQFNIEKCEVTHFIFDKYIMQNVPFNVSVNTRNLDLVLTDIYRDFVPTRIVVNNTVMENDFKYFCKKNNLNIKVVVAPNPVSPLMLERRQYLLDRSLPKDPKKLVLVDTIHPSKSSTFSALSSNLCICPPSYDLDLGVNTMLIGLLNYREKNGYFLSRTRKIAQLRDLVSYSVKNSSALFNTFSRKYDIKLINQMNRNGFVENINTRWKPNTKFTVAAALGIPLISQPEISIEESQLKYDFPVYFFRSANELDACVKRLQTMDTSYFKILRERGERSLELIREDYIKAIS